MNDLCVISIALFAGLLVFVCMWLAGPPKNWWCNRSEMHEFGEWEDFEGPELKYHYQSRVCKKCKYKDIKHEYIGWY